MISPWRGRLKNFFSRDRSEDMPAEELRTILHESDLSPRLVARLVQTFEGSRDREREAVRRLMSEELRTALTSTDSPIRSVPIPGAVLLLGVNGAGKTTVAAKLAYRFRREGRPVILAAADTFRAGAIDQLKAWAKKLEVDIVAQQPGADPGAVVFDGWQKAKSANAILIVDTAGRLHTKQPLVEELKKIVRIMSRDGSGAPHESYLVLDGTMGQNATSQSREFSKAVPITGLILTKMDGTSKGGGAVSSSLEFSLPIRYLGTGERLENLEPFEARRFSEEFFQE